ncbi:MAG: tRNA lysidine(34) synthetase TilS [Planctomycetia bacterium]|nr:tRNA lysidine(34) synthetase TilS [Planctomycetia bacterium]
MPEKPPFLDRLSASWPPSEWWECGAVVAVSGGADSVALVRGMQAVAGSQSEAICVAHLDHGLRGEAGVADAEFVRRLADELSLQAVIGAVDVPSERRGGEGIEAAARRARYRFLRRTAEARGARFVAVGHTADDQAETVLHRLLRGSGLQGLAGMSRARSLGPAVSLVRPLLEFRRRELREYLAGIGQPWREDRTNDDQQFTRNRLRRRLLPILEQDYGPNVVPAICRTAAMATEAQTILLAVAHGLADEATSRQEASLVVVRCGALAGVSALIISETLRIFWRQQQWPEQSMGFSEWRVLTAIVQTPGEVAARMLPGGIRAEKKGDELWLSRP